MDWIKQGVHYVVPKNILGLLSWEEIEIRASGEKNIDVEKLKKITDYCNGDGDSKYIQRFWRVLENMSDELKQAYLKFVWGRQRLPVDMTNLDYRHSIYLLSDTGDGDKSLPESHTCFFQLDLPCYSTDEICEQRITTAITFCGEIDTDYGANNIADEDGDNEY